MTGRRRVLSGAAIVVAVVLVALFIERRAGTHRGQIDSGSIVMLGDSITEQADWDELLPDLPIVNRGHSGYTTEQLVPVADAIGDARPRGVFVLTGTNDIRDGRSPDWTAEHLNRLLDSLARRSPGPSSSSRRCYREPTSQRRWRRRTKRSGPLLRTEESASSSCTDRSTTVLAAFARMRRPTEFTSRRAATGGGRRCSLRRSTASEPAPTPRCDPT